VGLVSDATLGALVALGSALTWAVNSLLVRQLAPTLNSVSVNALRSTAGGALLLVWVLATGAAHRIAGISATSLILLAVSIVLAIAVGDTIFFESVRALGLARAMTVSMTYPLLAAGLAAVFLGERITLPVIAGSIVILAGLTLIVAGRSEGPTTPRHFWGGIAGASVASLAWAISVVVLKAPLGEIDAITAQAVRLPVAGLLLWATPWARGAVGRLRESGRAPRWTFAALVVLTAVSSVMFVAGVKYAGVAVASVLSSTAPMFAIPLGAFALGERPTASAVAGTLLTVAGIAVLQL
jgi:drug/metabolite transporter (DMT)-like permease